MPEYNVRVSTDTPYALSITARFEGLRTSEAVFYLPVWRPGRYQRLHYAQYIQWLEVRDGEGRALPAVKTTPSAWRVTLEEGDTVVFHYRYYCDLLDAGRTFWDGRYLLFNPVACCLYTDAQRHKPCHVRLRLPEGCHCAGTPVMERDTENRLVWEAPDYHTLVDRPVLAGPQLQRLTFECQEAAFEIVTAGEVDLSGRAARLKADFESFSRAQHRLFGRWPFESPYRFLVLAPPYRHYHGVEHANDTVIVFGPGEALLGEQYDDFLGVSSHELFHAWNVKAIRPAPFAPYDYQNPPVSPLGYVYEGCTTYYGDLMLLRGGAYPWATYAGELAGLLQRHLHNEGRLMRSVADSSRDTELDGYQQGVPHRKSSIYIEGAVAAFLLDVALRRATANQRSLDDLFRLLDKRFASQGQPYREADYWEIARELGGEAVLDVRRHYVEGCSDTTEALQAAFGYLGIQMQLQPASDLIAGQLGLRLRDSKDGLQVGLVARHSPWHPQVARNDLLLSLDEHPLEVREDLRRLLKTPDGGFHTLVFKRQGRIESRQVELPEANRFYPEPHLVAETKPTAAQREAFHAWSHLERFPGA